METVQVGNSRLLALGFSDGTVQVWKRIRPEAQWGAIHIAETWEAGLFLVLTLARFRSDRRLLARTG